MNNPSAVPLTAGVVGVLDDETSEVTRITSLLGHRHDSSPEATVQSEELLTNIVNSSSRQEAVSEPFRFAMFGNFVCAAATDFREFLDLLRSYHFDAVSIDWELYDVEKGPDILDLLCTDYPEMARVVYTKHGLRYKEAIAHDADICLVKKPGNDEEYRRVMEKAVRLGLARRIVKRLSESGVTDVPELPPGKLLDEETEDRIYMSAMSLALQKCLEEQEDVQMTELLRRRGLWREFDAKAFVRLPWRKKIAQLAEYVGASHSHLARILRVDRRVVTDVLRGEVPDGGVNRDTLTTMDQLLSVMGYVLRLSGYRPDLMLHFWEVKDLYKDSATKPPWHGLGLATYLEAGGPDGVTTALSWIRSN